MKKKQIEAIPYITIPTPKRNKVVKYVAITALKDVGDEQHIMLEVYRNKKNSLQIPIARYTATRKDWGVFFTETGEWSRQNIAAAGGYGSFCWQQSEKFDTPQEREKRTVLYSSDDMDRVRQFFKGITVWNESEWWDYFRKNEKEIKAAAKSRKQELRAERLRERIKNTPALKEQDLLKWSDKALFYEKHVLYYRKKGRRAVVCCSACGGVAERVWKTGESYESQFEKHIEEPVSGQIGNCFLCGARGTYHPQGRARHIWQMKNYVFLADRYLDRGVVLRYIQIEKKYILDEMVGETGQPEMMGACEGLSGVEIARTYFEPSKKVQTDYQKYNPYTGKDFWDDCNLYGMNSISIDKGMVHPDTWENLKGSYLQYCGMKEYAQSVRGILDAKGYLERYLKFPQIEMLSKMKMFGVVEMLVQGRHYNIVRCNMAKRPDLFLGIRPERVKLLIKSSGDISVLNVLQIERAMEQNWTEEQIRDLAEIDVRKGNLEMALKVMSVQKLLNAVARYAGCEYGTECSTAQERLKNTATTYFDYLSMRQQLGYDLANTVYQRPKNLRNAHAKMVMEMDKTEQDRRMREAEATFCKIKQDYRKLRSRYYYEDEVYLIRPARSAGEIVREGRMLHHCVGGNNYLRKHNEGQTYILMLRKKEEPDIPYITVEIDKNFEILQWYGAHNNKPDKKNMQRWLDVYTVMLICRQNGTTIQPEQEAVQLLAYA